MLLFVFCIVAKLQKNMQRMSASLIEVIVLNKNDWIMNISQSFTVYY